MKRLITLTFQYYRLLLLYNIAFSLIGLLLMRFGGGLNLAGIFWGKLFGFVAAVALYHYSAAKSYFYFRNAGLSIRRLWVYSLGVEVVVALIFTYLFHLL